MSIMTIITVTIIANNFTIIYSPCSVPYRGYSFFNAKISSAHKGKDPVSVPYRGYSFFNPKKDFSYNVNNSQKVSVPYRGYSFFNTENMDCLGLPSDIVSVPYRGYSFFNTCQLFNYMVVNQR